MRERARITLRENFIKRHNRSTDVRTLNSYNLTECKTQSKYLSIINNMFKTLKRVFTGKFFVLNYSMQQKITEIAKGIYREQKV